MHILEYEIPFSITDLERGHSEYIVKMPHNTYILSVGEQADRIVIWAIVSNGSNPVIDRYFHVFVTGVSLREYGQLSFVGTVRMSDGHVCHVFDGGFASSAIYSRKTQPLETYTMRDGLPGISALPTNINWGWVEAPGNGRLEKLNVPRSVYPWGVFTTSRPLHQDELQQFGIIKVPVSVLGKGHNSEDGATHD